MRRLFLCLLFPACNAPIDVPDGGGDAGPPWLSNAQVLVQGDGVEQADCQTNICRHNENTDMTLWNGAMWLVHRTAASQKLGDNCSLHVYRSDDAGAHFTDVATILPTPTRDMRDPAFYQVGGTLHMKALTRLNVVSLRDSDVDTITVETHTTDGTTWSPFQQIAPNGWSFWRVKQGADGMFYSVAYQDGDLQVVLFSSPDGIQWTQGAVVYGVSADTPVETELSFLPSGKLLALVRMDGTDTELLGESGRLRTAACFADPPYAQFSCSIIDGVRLDGPLTFFWQGRLFVVARKHLATGDRKRTALYEVTGTLEGGPIAVQEWGELPSAGDTSYAGVAAIDDHRVEVSWYSGAIWLDEDWLLGIYDSTDIWTATIDLSKL